MKLLSRIFSLAHMCFIQDVVAWILPHKFTHQYYAHPPSSDNQDSEDVSDSEKLTFNLMRNLNFVSFDEVKFDDTAVPSESSFTENKITRINFSSSNLQAYVLPEGLQWPTVSADKQWSASCPNLYLHRGGVPNDGRMRETIGYLRAGENVVWLGSPGIGKTWGLNIILMEFLRNIGEPGWPPNVLVRSSSDLYHFVLREGELCIHKENTETLLEAERYCSRFKKVWDRRKPDAVLLLELKEKEVDPTFCCTVFTTTSSRDAYTNLKTLTKSGTAWMVVDPWKKDEVKAATIAQHIVMRTTTIDDDLGISMERFNVIGGLPRYIFTNKLKYQSYLKELQPVRIGRIKQMEELRIENIPQDMKYYIAPFVREGVEVPLLGSEWEGFRLDSSYSRPKSPPIYEFGFLSEYVKKLFIDLITTPEELKLLKSFGFTYQIDEAIVKHGGLLSDSSTDMAPRYQRGEWEWYRDPGSKNKVSSTYKLSGSEIPKLPWCVSEEKFLSQKLEIPVHELKSQTCYTSKKHNAPVTDMIVVDKEEHVVYAVQVTGLDVVNHPFREETLKEFMRNLGLLDVDDKPTGGYRLCIIAVTDWSRLPSGGVVTYVDKKDGLKRSVSEINEPWAKIVDCYIVRACLSNGSVEIKILVEN